MPKLTHYFERYIMIRDTNTYCFFARLNIFRNSVVCIKDEGVWPRQHSFYQFKQIIANWPCKVGYLAHVVANKRKVCLFRFQSFDAGNALNSFRLEDIATQAVNSIGWVNYYSAIVKTFNNFTDPDKTSQYTLIRRDEDGNLKVMWYHEAYRVQIEKAVDLLRKAAEISENDGFKNYLNLRAEALLTDDYKASDMAWMDMKNSNIDFIVGPIENYEDQMFGCKAAFESFILIKDPDWSSRLQRFAALLPSLQTMIPTNEKYLKDAPGSDSDLNVYDAIFYAGDCNAGSKTIAINLPNDPEVHVAKGTRKLQLKNSMKAKFDKILIPIAKILIDPVQQKHVTFDAFFANTMFHEVAHGMGVKNTVTGKGSVREALKETYTSIEEGKADIMGLWLVSRLREMGEISDGELMDNLVTFSAGLFRSSRFGTASAHGKANMMRFNFFEEHGAFTRSDKGFYTVNMEEMLEAMNILVDKIMTIQGEGDYEAAKAWIEADGNVSESLEYDLNRLNDYGIPVDIYFKQGPDVAGIK
jgi:hypothetical protein